jgi:signal transduction histidine kinase
MDLTKKDGYLLLAIKDTGMGLGKGEKEQLFQKFVRGANAPRLHTEGAGIGLYVAKKMLEEHKGEVWAESEGEGKGSTFFVKLPEWTEARQ